MEHAVQHRLFNRLGVGIFRYELKPKESFVHVNKAFAKAFHISDLSEFKHLKMSELVSNPGDYSRFLEYCVNSKKIQYFKIQARTKKNKPVWLSLTAKLIRGKDNREFIEGIVQNISSQQAEDDRLAYESDALQTILDSIPDAIYFKDRKNRITRVNKFYAEGFGGRLENILGKTDFDFFPAEQAREMFKDDQSVLRTGKPIVGKIERTLLPSGSWNQVITTKVPMFDFRGKIIGTLGLTRDMTAHANIEYERYTMVLKALVVLSRALELRDPYTQSHARDVSAIAQMVAKELHFDEKGLMGIRIAGELHDVGKIGIPLDILIKPGKLTDLEYRLIKEHTTNCYNMIRDIEFPFPLAEIIYQHHERLDGSGYPRGLKGDEVLKESRILAVSDVLESMTHHRPYRAALGIEKAMEELKGGRGIRYDAEVVDVVAKLIRKNGGKPFWNNSFGANF